MPQDFNPGQPRKIYTTGRMAYPSDPSSAYIMVPARDQRPNILQRALGAIADVFQNMLPDRGGNATVTDDSLVIKTSPTIWEYQQFALEYDRRSVLREVEQMLREEPRVARANRVLASTTVRKGFTVTVASKVDKKLAEQAQDIINELMHDCQINAKLTSWARILPKDGDLFLNPVVDLNSRRIKNIKRLPAISMQRCEDITGNFQSNNKAFRQIDPISLDVIEEFPLWQINHIRYCHEEGERYGQSQYLQLRGYWKKLKMTEEDLVVRRRTRAIPRRFHQVGTKDAPGTERGILDYKARNKLDPRTSQITADFYGNGYTDVKNLDGDADLDHIRDIEYLLENYMIGTGVPLHLLGFGKIGAGADIIEAQERQFKEDTQELRDLLEYGDSGTYSGLRPIFDLALMLQGLDPTLVEYNISWYAADNETASERVNRGVKLRGMQPKPGVSQKRFLTMIAKDIGLENDEAIDAELEQIELELELDRTDQETLKAELNPEKPPTTPLSRPAVTEGMADARSSYRSRKKKASHRSVAYVRGLWNELSSVN